MPCILVVGNVTLDIVNVVESYPHEDDEVRAVAQYRTRGGNAGNTAVVLAQLGNQVSFAGMLADEPDLQFIRQDFEHHHVHLDTVMVISKGKIPTSYVTLSRANGSRTIVHYRDLPEYPSTAFARTNLSRYDAIHFEGRNLDEVKRMLERVRKEKPQCLISIEAEKPRLGIQELFPHADLLLFSRVFARHQGYDNAGEFLTSVHTQAPGARLACGWGSDGAYALDIAGRLLFTPAFPPPKVVDTLGAGDVFNAGMIDALARRLGLEKALIEAARLAGKKCGQQGFDGQRL